MNKTSKLEQLRLSMAGCLSDEDNEAFSKLLLAARCALADLEGSIKAHKSDGWLAHDWKAHQSTINELAQIIGEEWKLEGQRNVSSNFIYRRNCEG
jgi:hypothetical protein